MAWRSEIGAGGGREPRGGGMERPLPPAAGRAARGYRSAMVSRMSVEETMPT